MELDSASIITGIITGLVIAIITQIVTSLLHTNSEKQLEKLKAKLVEENRQNKVFSEKQTSVLLTLLDKIYKINEIYSLNNHDDQISRIEDKLCNLEIFCDKNRLYLTDELIELINRFLKISEPTSFNYENSDYNQLVEIYRSLQENIKKIIKP